MNHYLLFRLYGPLASWGEIAVGEWRHSAFYPSKSSLLGLLGAALGLERSAESAHAALAQHYRFAVQLLSAGCVLRDYHTTQLPEPQRKVVHRSRRQELLQAAKVGTLLSQREYRCDALAVVALEALAEAPYRLEQLAQALRYPQFPLYLGRKSCPLALPLQPQLLSAEHLLAAFSQAQWPSLLALSERKPEQAFPSPADRRALGLWQALERYYWEPGMQFGADPVLQQQRHDQPVSRQRWQFTPRQEWVYWAKQESEA